jgi:hypothetical protein
MRRRGVLGRRHADAQLLLLPAFGQYPQGQRPEAVNAMLVAHRAVGDRRSSTTPQRGVG